MRFSFSSPRVFFSWFFESVRSFSLARLLIHYLLIGWILLLFCAVIAMHSSSLVGKSQLDALLAPTTDPQGAGFFPLSIPNELSNIRFLGEMANADPDSFIVSIMTDPDQTLLYIAAKWGWLALGAISLLYFSFLAGTIFLQKGKFGITCTTTYILAVICTVCYILSLMGSFGVGNLYTFSHSFPETGLWSACFCSLFGR